MNYLAAVQKSLCPFKLNSAGNTKFYLFNSGNIT
jgi:hypothetical protein